MPSEISGHGQNVSIIIYSGTTGNVLSVSCAQGPEIHDLAITATSNRTSGDGIYIQGSSSTSLCSTSEVYSVRLSGHQHGLTFFNCFNCNVSFCLFAQNKYGIYINSPQFPDEGFGQIVNSYFSGNRSDAIAGIYQLNNGGITIIGNGCYGDGALSYFYLFQLSDTVQTSDVTISDNYIDGLGVASISFQGPPTTGTLTNIAITGNTLSQLNLGSVNMLEVKGGATLWLRLFAITGNVFLYSENTGGGGGGGISFTNAQLGLVAANSFFGTQSNATAISIDSSCSSIIASRDNFYNNNGISVVNNQSFPTIASAATIALPQIGDLFKITGTTNISTMTGGWPQRAVSLLIPSGIVFHTGGNIAIALTAAAGSLVNAAFDGTSWYLK